MCAGQMVILGELLPISAIPLFARSGCAHLVCGQLSIGAADEEKNNPKRVGKIAMCTVTLILDSMGHLG